MGIALQALIWLCVGDVAPTYNKRELEVIRPPTPLLDRLVKHRVFGVEWNGSVFVLEEHCDGNFSDEFTAEEITELAGELLALAASVS